MARPSSTQPTDGELEILKILWRVGPAELGTIRAALQENRPIASTTVATMLKLMREKGLVERADGPRGYIWTASVSLEATRSGLLGKLLNLAFDGSAHRLIAHLFEEGKLSDQDRDAIRHMIDSQETKPCLEKGETLMMIPDWSASPLWSVVGWTMLHFLWIGTILGASAVVGRRLLRNAKAETQYIYGLICLMILAVTPLLLAMAMISETGAFVIAGAPTASPPLASRLPGTSAYQSHEESWISPLPDRALRAAITSRADDESHLGVGRRLVAALALYLPYLWLAGTPITFAYLAMGLAGAERLRRQSVAIVDPGLVEVVQRLTDSLGVTRRVVLATCERLCSPVLVGILRPTILLPAAALTGWSPDQLEMALMHELVHVRRWDNAVILLQRLIEAALFFHPVIWMVSGWVHREREHCCDEGVVRHTGRPLAYAEALLALSDFKAKPSRNTATVAMAEGDLVSRVRRLLDQENHAMKLPRITITLTTGLLLAPVLLIGAQAALSRADDQPPKGRVNEVAGPAKAENGGRDKSHDDATHKAAEEVLKIVGKTADKSDSITLTNIAKAQVKLGDRAAALETLRQTARVAAKAKQSVVRQGNTVSYGLSSAWQLRRVGHLQAQLGDKPGALESLRLARQAKDEQEADLGSAKK